MFLPLTSKECPCKYITEEVLHGDVTAGIKHEWTSTAFFSFRGILLPVFFKVCTGAGPVDALKVQSLNSNTKVSKVQVHLLSEGPTRGLGVGLICWSMHLHSSEYQNTSPLLHCYNRLLILLWQFVLKEEGPSRIR